MKIHDLKKYQDYAEELECVEAQLAGKYVCDSVLGDSGEPAHEQVSKPVEGYIHGLGTVSLLVEEAHLMRKMAEIEEYIAAIPVTRIRKALEIYCYSEKSKKMTWGKVADKMGEVDENNLRKAVERYLCQIEQD